MEHEKGVPRFQRICRRDGHATRLRTQLSNLWLFVVEDAEERLYMLHTLAHLLMSAISLECGYAASALRERIYAIRAASDMKPMAGLLISTGTTGSEGTLGGLVEQGRQIRAHLRFAWDLGNLCSNDPVCGAHSPEGDQAERHLEGAACHASLFVAECSCERFNRYLDRALVVPTLGNDPEVAFFSKQP